jgi:hypothetical protein
MALGQQQQQLPQRLVGPMDIVEEHRKRVVDADAGEQAGHPLDHVLVEALGAAWRVGDLGVGQQRRQVGEPTAAGRTGPSGVQVAHMPAERGRPTAHGGIRRKGELRAVSVRGSSSSPASSSTASLVLPIPGSPITHGTRNSPARYVAGRPAPCGAA